MEPVSCQALETVAVKGAQFTNLHPLAGSQGCWLVGVSGSDTGRAEGSAALVCTLVAASMYHLALPFH